MKLLSFLIASIDTTFSFWGLEFSLLSFLSYIVDWILYLYFINCLYCHFLCSNNIFRTIALISGALYNTEPLFQEFSLLDVRIMYAHYPEAIVISPIWMLILTSIIIPVVMGFLISVSAIWKWPRRLWDFHIYCLGLTGALAFQFMVVVLLKNSTGRPRPDMLARCQPWSLTFPPPGTLANIIICTNNNFVLLWDGFRSFPSGHASSKCLFSCHPCANI